MKKIFPLFLLFLSAQAFKEGLKRKRSYDDPELLEKKIKKISKVHKSETMSIEHYDCHNKQGAEDLLAESFQKFHIGSKKSLSQNIKRKSETQEDFFEEFFIEKKRKLNPFYKKKMGYFTMQFFLEKTREQLSRSSFVNFIKTHPGFLKLFEKFAKSAFSQVGIDQAEIEKERKISRFALLHSLKDMKLSGTNPYIREVLDYFMIEDKPFEEYNFYIDLEGFEDIDSCIKPFLRCYQKNIKKLSFKNFNPNIFQNIFYDFETINKLSLSCLTDIKNLDETFFPKNLEILNLESESILLTGLPRNIKSLSIHTKKMDIDEKAAHMSNLSQLSILIDKDLKIDFVCHFKNLKTLILKNVPNNLDFLKNLPLLERLIFLKDQKGLEQEEEHISKDPLIFKDLINLKTVAFLFKNEERLEECFVNKDSVKAILHAPCLENLILNCHFQSEEQTAQERQRLNSLSRHLNHETRFVLNL